MMKNYKHVRQQQWKSDRVILMTDEMKMQHVGTNKILFSSPRNCTSTYAAATTTQKEKQLTEFSSPLFFTSYMDFQ